MQANNPYPIQPTNPTVLDHLPSGGCLFSNPPEDPPTKDHATVQYAVQAHRVTTSSGSAPADQNSIPLSGQTTNTFA